MLRFASLAAGSPLTAPRTAVVWRRQAALFATKPGATSTAATAAKTETQTAASTEEPRKKGPPTRAPVSTAPVFYAVWRGRRTGVLTKYDDVKRSVLGYAGSSFRKFETVSYTHLTLPTN